MRLMIVKGATDWALFPKLTHELSDLVWVEADLRFRVTGWLDAYLEAHEIASNVPLQMAAVRAGGGMQFAGRLGTSFHTHQIRFPVSQNFFLLTCSLAAEDRAELMDLRLPLIQIVGGGPQAFLPTL